MTLPPQLTHIKDLEVWKKRFEVYVKANYHINLWRVIESGDYIIPKKEESEEDKSKLVGENYSAMHLLYCALSGAEFIAASKCDTAHDIWTTLDKHKIKYKIDLLAKDFEKFKMDIVYDESLKYYPSPYAYESIDRMFGRYYHIITSLKALGECYSEKKCVERFLSALPANSKWNAKVTEIRLREMKKINNSDDVVSLKDVIQELQDYESRYKKGTSTFARCFGCFGRFNNN